MTVPPLPPHLLELLGRDPARDRNALDLASFYVEGLKYGPGPGQLESVSDEQIVNQLEVLLRDAGVTSMTGRQLAEAYEFYARSLALTLRVPLMVTRTVFLDGLVHGIALAGDVRGEPRGPRAAGGDHG